MERLPLKPGDKFLVRFDTDDSDINEFHLVFKDHWLRVREIIDHPEYYEGCVYGADYYPEDNNGAIVQTLGSLKTMRWQQGQDFLVSKQREPVAPAPKHGQLPNI